MKKSLTIFACIILLLTSTLAEAQKSRSKRKTISKPPVESNAILYEITGKNLKKPSYLFGTIHIICPSGMFPPEKLTKFVARSESILMELDFDDPGLVQKISSALIMPDGKTLADFLTPQQYATVDEMFKSFLGTSVEGFKIFSPIALTAAIMRSPKSVGCTTPTSYEQSIVKMAATRNLKVEGLESIEEQVTALAKIPLNKQAESLYKMAVAPQESVNLFNDLMRIYREQDSEKLFALIQKESTIEPIFQVSLVDERNRNWIPKIENFLKFKSSFIAVGGGHLGGSSGLVKLLRDRGYTLNAIKL